MNQGLSGGAKAGYFFLGFFLSWIGILIAWLVNKDKGELLKKEAMKFAIIGFVVSLVLGIIYFVVVFAVLGSAVSSGAFNSLY